MCFLFDVPNEIAATILSNWIDVFDLASLDSAVCRRDTRREFCAVVRSDHFLQTRCEWRDIQPPCTKFVMWLSNPRSGL
jgi:hypothetical protein